MTYITSRSFRLPEEAQEMDGWVWFNLWTKRLWPPSYQPRWNTHVYVWRDRKAKLELYVADGICHLVHQLN